MAGTIPRPFIDDLLSRIDIVDVIDEYVPLTRAGRDFKACCPFHAEKTPSFTVSRAKQFYHCFGCQANGTAITFLMEYARLDFVEAIEDLAHRVGVEVPRSGGASRERPSSEPVLDILERANRFYRRQLRQHPQAPRAVDYLRSRGVSGEIAAAFQLGFAPAGWDNLVKGLATQATGELMVRAGLAARRDGGGLYDRFRDRIVFPIHDRRSRTVAFGGRSIGDGTPKYLNSPETPVFHKGREIYGLPQARAAGGKRVVVVEGYMDVVALAQHGVGNTVATLGTSVTPEHLKQLFRIWSDVVFCFDGDEAGNRAAWRALETALPLLRDGRRALFTFLPGGEDPDSLVRARGREHFEACVDGAEPLGAFLFERLKAQVNLQTLDGRVRLFESALPLIVKMPVGAFRDMAIQELEQLTQRSVEPASIRRAEAQARPAAHREPAPGKKAGGVKAGGTMDPRVRKALARLVQYPGLAGVVETPAALRGIGLSGASLLADVVEICAANPQVSTGALIERFRDRADGGHYLVSLAAEPLVLESRLQDPEQALRGEFQSLLLQIRREVARRAEDARLRELDAKDFGELTDDERREYAQLTARPTG